MTKKTKYQIGQFVRFKDAKLQSEFPSVNGLIVGLVGCWQGTKQGYGLLTDVGLVLDFKEEELAPMTNAEQLYIAMRRATMCLDEHYKEVLTEARMYWKSITL